MTTTQLQTGDLVTARGREWIVLGLTGEDLLRVRPLSGSEDDAQNIAPALESEPVQPARFAPPGADTADTQDAARLMADALRLSLRRGAGPFRSAAHLGVEPRAYQLVPMLMALKMETKRLLIADDVGIGKTIEAGMILREMIDRGEVSRFTVLCPPHLVDQWVDELAQKFDLDAVAVTASRARSLERGLALSESIFDAYPYTVVSLDYIKSDNRRDSFALSCPEFVIADEAHSCVGGTEKGTQQRFTLLQRLAETESRHLLLLTATPHSGNQDAYARLLGLIHSDLAEHPGTKDQNLLERYRRRLAQHFVQRRRADIEENWGDASAFAKAHSREAPYNLTGDFQTFQEDVLDYCVEHAIKTDGENARRLAFWGTLALMRCVGSSPAAAASALRNRLTGMIEAQTDALQPVVFDDEDGMLTDSDIEPATGTAVDQQSGEQARLTGLIEQAEMLAQRFADDPKFTQLVRQLKDLERSGTSSVVFCRFISTAEAVGAQLKTVFKKHRVEVVTGRLTPDERRARVEDMANNTPRILVATDCLSEGINLQQLFNAVVHYDLNWNPTRHQQREGRVDRFGQPADDVWSVMMFGANSMIDGAVIQVITDKADRIREALGVTVPVPEDSASVTSALMQALLLKSENHRAQGLFDFADAETQVDIEWQSAEDAARKSLTRYAQGALKPEEVLPEWRQMKALNGGPEEVERFTRRALSRIGAPLDTSGKVLLVHYDALPQQMRERMAARGLSKSRMIAFTDDPAPGVMHIGRVHPLVATLAETLAEGALDPGSMRDFEPLGRAGAWRTRSVDILTTVLLMRLRFTLTVSGRRTLLADEATAIAFSQGRTEPCMTGSEALGLLEEEASGNIETFAITRQITTALDRLPDYASAIETFARERAAILSQDHDRVKAATRGEGATTDVEPALPADIIGLYVLVPESV